MRGRHRTTVVRVVAVASLVVLARTLTGHGGDPDRQSPPVMAQTVVAAMKSETPAQAGQRILAEYAQYPALTGPEAEAALRDMASRAAAGALVAILHTDLARLALGYPGGPTRFWVGPLAARELAGDESGAKVEIWFCRVVAPPGQQVYAEWRLGVIDLVWERDAWRLNGFDEIPGPRPAALPGEDDQAAEILAAIAGFEATSP